MQWFIALPLFAQITILYFIAINTVTFFYFGWDKMQSSLHKQRVSEKMLWLLSLIGGTIGAITGMHFFRHKTQKLSFQTGMAIILVLQVWFVVLIIPD